MPLHPLWPVITVRAVSSMHKEYICNTVSAYRHFSVD
jgi:hypothetical protein